MNFIIRLWNTQREMEMQGNGRGRKRRREKRKRGGERRGCHSGSVCQYWQCISPLAGDWNNSQPQSNYKRCLLLLGILHIPQHASVPYCREVCTVTYMLIWTYAFPPYFLLQYVVTKCTPQPLWPKMSQGCGCIQAAMSQDTWLDDSLPSSG